MIQVSELKTKLTEPAPIYLVLGTESVLIQQAKTAFMALLTREEKAMNFAAYDMTVDDLGVALDDATSVPFFGERRLVFITHPYFLTAETPKGSQQQDVTGLLGYLNQPLNSTVLVIFAPYAKLDARKKLSKLLQKKAETVDVSQLTGSALTRGLNQLLRQKKLQIDTQSKNLLLQRANGDFSDMAANLNKLELAADDGVISTAMVQDLVSPTLENNVFDLVTYVLQKDVQKALQLYADLILNREEPIKINRILLSQFRLLLQVKILWQKGMSQGDLTQVLKVHPYRIKLAMQAVKKFEMSDLKKAYLGLQDNDYKMKSSSGDKRLLFEIFMLQFAQVK